MSWAPPRTSFHIDRMNAPRNLISCCPVPSTSPPMLPEARNLGAGQLCRRAGLKDPPPYSTERIERSFSQRGDATRTHQAPPVTSRPLHCRIDIDYALNVHGTVRRYRWFPSRCAKQEAGGDGATRLPSTTLTNTIG